MWEAENITRFIDEKPETWQVKQIGSGHVPRKWQF